jgi:NAD(P) transhydrogenase subunit alpha
VPSYVTVLHVIATTKRLETTDSRAETKKQTESIGAKFIEVDTDGEELYTVRAEVVSEYYVQRQKEAVNKSLFNADLAITKALVHRRKSPVPIIKEQIDKRNNGAEIIDLASLIFGMPILEAEKANQIIINKRSMKPGHASIEN